ncbi:MAG: hypothetical protein ACKOXS_03220 [Actinomycetes bacterium]
MNLAPLPIGSANNQAPANMARIAKIKVSTRDQSFAFIKENPTAIGPTANVVNTTSAAISAKDSIKVV